MKKLIALCLVLLFAAPAFTVYAESSLQKELNKELVKQLKKNYKKRKKELEKDKWKIQGSTKTLEVALLEHYTKLYNEDDVAEEIVGTADNFKSTNIGRRQAVTNAQMSYAQRAGANADDVNAEFEHFYAAYEANVQKEIGMELQESFTLMRPHAGGKSTYDMQIFFIVSENAATRARVRAYENALKESEAAQRYADRVSQFIQEAVTPVASN